MRGFRSAAPALACLAAVACTRTPQRVPPGEVATAALEAGGESAAAVPPNCEAAEAGAPQAGAYFEFQVTRPATPRPERPLPSEQPAGPGAPTGEVLVQFVVDPLGAPDLASFRVLKADHPDLGAMARAVVARARFIPAEQQPGCLVRQHVQYTFRFRRADP